MRFIEEITKHLERHQPLAMAHRQKAEKLSQKLREVATASMRVVGTHVEQAGSIVESEQEITEDLELYRLSVIDSTDGSKSTIEFSWKPVQPRFFCKTSFGGEAKKTRLANAKFDAPDPEVVADSEIELRTHWAYENLSYFIRIALRA